MQATTDKAKEIFLQALELTSDAARSSFIDSSCGTDTELRQRVETLLHSHRPDDSFLDPRKLHLHQGTGNTHTSDFADTDESPGKVGQKRDASGTLSSWFDPPTQPDSLGRFLHYEVLEELGQGGFGVVYKAFDNKLHRVVALKILSPALASNGAAKQRFLREARATAAVRHEHVISIHAVDDAPLPHLVMEYISGQTLQQKIDKVGQLRVKEILRIGMQMAQGLEAAHRQGLIHRDIKPSNILLENGIERVKITDFGLARAVDDTSISHQGLIVGTPSFMSPEQAEGKPVDARSDLFSLGSTMYAMCTGLPPFQAPSTMAVLKKVVEETPASLIKINSEIPVRLQSVINKLLAKKPEQRYQEASEIARDLSHQLAEMQSGNSTPQPVSHRKKWWAAVGLIFILLAIFAFTEISGLTRITRPLLGSFYHELTFTQADPDTTVEIWETTDVGQGPATTVISKMPIAPTTGSDDGASHRLSLPPGRYWFFVRHQGVQIYSRLLTIPWGGTSNISWPAPGVPDLAQNSVPSVQPTLLRRYDPKKDRPTPASWADPTTTVKVEGDTWRLENNTDGGNFRFTFAPILENIPREGIIICKAKIKLEKKDPKCWGNMELDPQGFGPDHSGFDWPEALYHYRADIKEWTEKEVRYPAHAFHERTPPQLAVAFGLHAPGILYVKGLELWHLPGQPVVETERTMQLIKLAQLAEQQMNDTEKRYKASAVSINEVISAKIKWLEARCKVAEDRKDYREAINLLGQIKEALDELFEIGKKRVAAGVMPVSELTPMKEAIINTEMRLTQVKEQAGKAKE